MASAAAVVAGWPLNVPAKNAGWPGVVEKRSISSALPPSAETGQPFAIALPSVVRSGVTPAIGLVAAEPVAEAGDHLVEDEDGAVLRGELAQPLEEPGLRQHRADVVRDRLEDDRGDVAVVLVERALDRVGVVERAHDRGRDDLGEHAAGERVLGADALGGRDHVHRDRVVPAVVAALELDHVAAAGRGAREPECVERRLAARAR